MALSERFENDKIEVVGTYKAVQVRKANIIEKDGVEISRTFERRALMSGTIDDSDNFVDTDISTEDTDVQAICNAAWTTTVKDAYKVFLIANKSGT
tara:strand:- start:22325 stop:22612 length:288 start_codon:yes stop_codon:yes gene_type:complete